MLVTAVVFVGHTTSEEQSFVESFFELFGVLCADVAAGAGGLEPFGLTDRR